IGDLHRVYRGGWKRRVEGGCGAGTKPHHHRHLYAELERHRNDKATPKGTRCVRGSLRSRFIISMPLKFGILMSVMMRFGSCSAATLNPTFPSSAVNTVKVSNSSSFAIISRVSSLSSTIKILSGTVEPFSEQLSSTRLIVVSDHFLDMMRQ